MSALMMCSAARQHCDDVVSLDSSTPLYVQRTCCSGHIKELAGRTEIGEESLDNKLFNTEQENELSGERGGDNEEKKMSEVPAKQTR